MKVCALVQCMCNVQCNSPRDIIKALEDSSTLWCGGIISPHCTIGSNWFGLKFEEKKESMLGFFNLNQYFVLIVFSTYFHFIHHIPKVNFQILYCALYLGTSPHPEIQSHPSVQSNPLIAPRCYIHLRWRLCGRESLNNIGPGPSKIGASWIFPSLSPLYSVRLAQLPACPHQQIWSKMLATKMHSI